MTKTFFLSKKSSPLKRIKLDLDIYSDLNRPEPGPVVDQEDKLIELESAKWLGLHVYTQPISSVTKKKPTVKISPLLHRSIAYPP